MEKSHPLASWSNLPLVTCESPAAVINCWNLLVRNGSLGVSIKPGLRDNRGDHPRVSHVPSILVFLGTLRTGSLGQPSSFILERSCSSWRVSLNVAKFRFFIVALPSDRLRRFVARCFDFHEVLTKCPVTKRIVAMSYSRLCPHLQQVRVVLPANVLGKE